MFCSCLFQTIKSRILKLLYVSLYYYPITKSGFCPNDTLKMATKVNASVALMWLTRLKKKLSSYCGILPHDHKNPLSFEDNKSVKLVQQRNAYIYDEHSPLSYKWNSPVFKWPHLALILLTFIQSPSLLISEAMALPSWALPAKPSLVKSDSNKSALAVVCACPRGDYFDSFLFFR